MREEGYKIILVNSNPATIMTDPEMADRTYVEPLTPETLEKIIARERPDALLPTIGGQTGLNLAAKLVELGVLKKYGVKLIGADYRAIHRAESRSEFKKTMNSIGLEVPKSGLASTTKQAEKIAKSIGFPLIIRPSFTLGGSGSGVAYNWEEYLEVVAVGLEKSPVSQVLVEESVMGWKEYELEVMRDKKDNVVIICSIENLDPMGVHTGDSITVAPAQTLTDKEYQRMRDASIAIIRAVGVETGGSNVQFGIHPDTGKMVVIEMNPRVSRSSALASKATGFPIAKIAAKLAVGYTLDEIRNDITRETPASFEPTIDYCVVKIPRFTFEKFPGSTPELTTSMRSVGETMAIGRTFREAFQKGMRSLETGHIGFDAKGEAAASGDLMAGVSKPSPDRLFYVKRAINEGWTNDKIYKESGIDPWFIENLREICRQEKTAVKKGKAILKNAAYLRELKRDGFSDRQLAEYTGRDEAVVRRTRLKQGTAASFKLVDTCAAEFEARTPYYYSTYEAEDESRAGKKRKVMILGGGPNRIGQGIEFDYCCVQAAFAARELGFETIMVNSNPETVSTDYDISDRLYFEPLVLEDVLNIYDREKPYGVIVQLGGQTPLNLAAGLMKAGVKILGTSPRDIARAEDRKQFRRLLNKLGLKQAESGTATSLDEARKVAEKIGFPVLVRPSFVLGGRAMEIVYSEDEFDRFVQLAFEASPGHPVLIDRFLEDAIEVDVDGLCDGRDFVIGGVMEHIERAGVHSGDSACVIPPHSLSPAVVRDIERQTRALALALNVRGLINIQYAVKGKEVYILEVNPRASRTVPFVSKAIGYPLARIASKVIIGSSLKKLGFTKPIRPRHFSVKEAVFPFQRFPGAEYILGPEMRSTGEVMGIGRTFGSAYAKSQLAAGQDLPSGGGVFLSVRDSDKEQLIKPARQLRQLGFKLYATSGTTAVLRISGIPVQGLQKISSGLRPNVLDLIKNRHIRLIVNTSEGRMPRRDEGLMRTAALEHDLPLVTTISGLAATTEGMMATKSGKISVRCLQEYHKGGR